MTLLDIFGWAASGSGIIAAILVSANLGEKITGYGFIIFTASSILWITAAALDDDAPLVTQNLVLFAINLYGIYRYLWAPHRAARR